MEFIETSVFTRLILELLTDDSYRRLQVVLEADPEAGQLIRGGGGIRKMRFALPGSGKRGGARVIYYWIRERHQILSAVGISQIEERRPLR